MTNPSQNNRAAAHLRLVPETGESARPHRWFCGACGAPGPADATPHPFARGCEACGDGLLLEAADALAPRPGEAFLLVDAALTVRSLSPAAVDLLAVAPEEAIGRPIAELLSAADAEAGPSGALPTAISAAAAGGEEEPTRMTVRPADVFGVRIPARIGVCGPPRAAVVVLD
ncbi:PAS domain-containing protein [Conexibacter arvalis]|uniref:PAS domain-containing protein n=1 Tax=Conexibacter arvalis TaxID=912552 RepID=A0A840I952_9ACTN|nr:PAS domain-containing protein [Conexibacter arvalis]MBB4661439.1 PAS domain-containing protein [Conexibacter arvalis]